MTRVSSGAILSRSVFDFFREMRCLSDFRRLLWCLPGLRYGRFSRHHQSRHNISNVSQKRYAFAAGEFIESVSEFL